MKNSNIFKSALTFYIAAPETHLYTTHCTMNSVTLNQYKWFIMRLGFEIVFFFLVFSPQLCVKVTPVSLYMGKGMVELPEIDEELLLSLKLEDTSKEASVKVVHTHLKR